MFSMYPSHPTQHQDKKMKSEHLSSNMFSSQTKTAPGEGSMFEAVALQQIQKIPVVQIFKYSWQKKNWKIDENENHDFQKLWKNIWEVTLRHFEVWDPNCSLFGLHVAGAEAVALCLLFCCPKWRKQHWKTHNNTTCYHNGLRPWSKYVAKFSPVESLHNLGLKIDGMWKGSWKVRFLVLTFTWFSWVHLSAT